MEELIEKLNDRTDQLDEEIRKGCFPFGGLVVKVVGWITKRQADRMWEELMEGDNE